MLYFKSYLFKYINERLCSRRSIFICSKDNWCVYAVCMIAVFYRTILLRECYHILVKSKQPTPKKKNCQNNQVKYQVNVLPLFILRNNKKFSYIIYNRCCFYFIKYNNSKEHILCRYIFCKTTGTWLLVFPWLKTYWFILIIQEY